MSHVPTEYEIETFSGRFVDMNKPNPETIKLDDIAHALAHICRYGGHCGYFYSVAEHAVFVSKRVERKDESRELQLAALHHDDAEAFLGDIPRPLKPLLGKTYSQMTERMDTAIRAALSLSEDEGRFAAAEVKSADNWALFVEARKLLPSQGREWWDGAQGSDAWNLEPLPSRIVTPDYWIGGLTPTQAKQHFIRRHKELIDD